MDRHVVVGEKEVEAFVRLLTDSKTENRCYGAQSLAQLASDLKTKLLLKNAKPIKNLCRLIGDSDTKISMAVMSTLINLSADPIFARDMLQNHVISRTFDGLFDSSNKVPDLYAILLSNITTTLEGARELLQIGNPLMGFYVTKLLEFFLIVPDQTQEKDRYAWIAGIFNNVTQIPEGRSFFLSEKRNLLKQLLPHLQYRSPIRRHGIFGTLKNCLFESTFHDKLLAEDDVLVALLLPLRGLETLSPTDKEGMPSVLSAPKSRETIVGIREICVDCLLLFSATKIGRDKMREKKVYPILREYDQQEQNEHVKENIFNLINVLMGLDENPTVNVNVNPATIVNDSFTFGNEEENEQNQKQEKPTSSQQQPLLLPKPKPVESDEEGDPIEEI